MPLKLKPNASVLPKKKLMLKKLKDNALQPKKPVWLMNFLRTYLLTKIKPKKI